MKSFEEFSNEINENELNESVRETNVSVITRALDKDKIKYTSKPSPNQGGLSVIAVGKDIRITVNKDGHVDYSHKGKSQDLVFTKIDDIAFKIVDYVNQEGIGSSAFGIF